MVYVVEQEVHKCLKNQKKGNKDINIERTEEALALQPNVVATGCPFCNTMMTDGVKHFNKMKKVCKRYCRINSGD